MSIGGRNIQKLPQLLVFGVQDPQHPQAARHSELASSRSDGAYGIYVPWPRAASQTGNWAEMDGEFFGATHSNKTWVIFWAKIRKGAKQNRGFEAKNGDRDFQQPKWGSSFFIGQKEWNLTWFNQPMAIKMCPSHGIALHLNIFEPWIPFLKWLKWLVDVGCSINWLGQWNQSDPFLSARTWTHFRYKGGACHRWIAREFSKNSRPAGRRLIISTMLNLISTMSTILPAICPAFFVTEFRWHVMPGASGKFSTPSQPFCFVLLCSLLEWGENRPGWGYRSTVVYRSFRALAQNVVKTAINLQSLWLHHVFSTFRPAMSGEIGEKEGLVRSVSGVNHDSIHVPISHQYSNITSQYIPLHPIKSLLIVKSPSNPPESPLDPTESPRSQMTCKSMA